MRPSPCGEGRFCFRGTGLEEWKDDGIWRSSLLEDGDAGRFGGTYRAELLKIIIFAAV